MIAALLSLLAGPIVLHGRISDAASNEPVVAAAVHLAGAGVARTTFTDARGAYTFDGVPSGRYRLLIVHPGFESTSLQVELSQGTAVRLDVPLDLRPVIGKPVGVVAHRIEPMHRGTTHDSARGPRLASRWLNMGPQSANALSEMVAARTAGTRPVPDPEGADAPHVLYIWGAGADQGRVLLDGATLAAPLHLGGILSPVDPELIDVAELRRGGAPPRLDGGTSHIMELTTRAARPIPVRTWGELDALATRLGLETAVPGGGAMVVSARRVNREVIDLLADRPFDYDYADVLARADWRTTARSRFSATVFATDETIMVPRDLDEDRATWSNLALAAGWTRESGRRDVSLRASFSRALAELPLLVAAGAHVESAVERFAIGAETTTSHATGRFTTGVELERIRFVREAGSEQSGLLDCDAVHACAVATSTIGAAYAETAWEARPRLRFTLGLRAGYHEERDRVDLLPRASAVALLSNDVALSVSAGRYSRSAIVDAASLQPSFTTTNAYESVTATAHATHVDVSLVRRTPQSAAGASAILRFYESQGSSPARSAAGVDAWWTYDGPVQTVVSYSYLRWTDAAADRPGERDRHLVGASASRSIGPWAVQLSAAWAARLPWVAIAFEDPETLTPLVGPEADRGAARTDDRSYLRLDGSISGRWTTEWLGRPVTIAPYIRVINALGRRDGLFYYRDGAEGRLRALASLPVLPTLGVSWSF